MQQFKITDNIYMVEVPVPQPEVNGKEQLTAHNHVWLIDRSGSMSPVIKDLVEDMVAKLPTLELGDTLSVGWFSGTGQRDFIFKGLKLSSKEDAAKIAKVLRDYAYTVGCTCFSEILNQTNQVVEDLKAFNQLFSLVFFTDGYPVVPNYQKELQEIDKAIAKVQGKLASVLIVGYGNQYNKELLVDMASKFGGTLVHSANLSEYSKSMTEFISDAKETGGKVELTVPSGINLLEGVCFSINSKTVVAYKPTDGKLSYTLPKSGKSAYYLLTSAPLAGVEVLNGDTLTKATIQRPAYAAALILVQKARTATALELLGALGDVALIDLANNAYTNDEYGRVEAKIRAAINSPQDRFVAGKDTHYLPKKDAFCLVDAMELLAKDDAAKFLPKHPSFDYNRIGLKTTAIDGTPKFEVKEQPEVPIGTLTWNDSKLNLSITCMLPGTVELDDKAAAMGFAKTYPTFIWRSYTIVKDGYCNVDRLPMLMSEATFKTLSSHGLTHPEVKWSQTEPIVLHLDRVPVMNRAIAESHTSAKDLAELAIKELELEFKVKALKKFKEILEEAGAKDVAAKKVLTPEQEGYLAQFYIGRNGFAAPSTVAEATDHYTAKEFSIKIKSFSSIPKPADVEAKLKLITETKTGKVPKLTPSENLMAESLKWIDANCGRQSLAKLNSTLAVVTSELRAIRHQIQKIKFAILLGKHWFNEFPSRNDATLEVSGYVITFALREVDVAI